MGKHYSKEIKLEAMRMYFEERKTQRAITATLGIRDPKRIQKWIIAYRREGQAAFEKRRQGILGSPPKKEKTQKYIERLEMENALLKKFHTELRKQEELAKRNIGSSTTTDKHTK